MYGNSTVLIAYSSLVHTVELVDMFMYRICAWACQIFLSAIFYIFLSAILDSTVLFNLVNYPVIFAQIIQ